MLKGVNKPIAIMAAALFLGTSAPAMAGSELQIEEFNVTIAKAKSQMMADPAAALSLARVAKTQIVPGSEAAARSDLIARWLEGEALIRLNRGAEAEGLIEAALEQASVSFQNEKVYADLLRSAASSQARAGNSSAALAYFTEASERYRALGDARSLAIVLQNTGSLYSQDREYEKALAFYRDAAESFTDDGRLTLSAHNNIGNALKGLERYSEAEEQFAKALTIAGNMNSPMLEMRILTNVASTQILRGAQDEAEATAMRAMQIADEYAQDWQPFIYGVLAQVELDRGNLESAETHIARTFGAQSLEDTNALFRDFHEAAVKIYSRNGKDQLAALHSTAFKRLSYNGT